MSQSNCASPNRDPFNHCESSFCLGKVKLLLPLNQMFRVPRQPPVRNFCALAKQLAPEVRHTWPMSSPFQVGTTSAQHSPQMLGSDTNVFCFGIKVCDVQSSLYTNSFGQLAHWEARRPVNHSLWYSNHAQFLNQTATGSESEVKRKRGPKRGVPMADMSVGQNQWDPILGKVNSPPILEPILVVGLNRMFTGANQFGFWPMA